MAAETPYLTVYDYTQGGVWTFIIAESPEAIMKEYPQLKIVPQLPEWMVEEGVENIPTIHLSDREDPYLAALRRERD